MVQDDSDYTANPNYQMVMSGFDAGAPAATSIPIALAVSTVMLTLPTTFSVALRYR
jgi:hypothetical protein